MEEWKPVVGFERYEVSTMGNVRRGGRIFTPGIDSYGYRQVNLYRNTIRYTRKVYRLVMEAFCPNIDNKPQIDHINRNRADDRLENLRWATASENCRNREGFDEDMIGIRWYPKNQTYMVRIMRNGREEYVGCRKDLVDAKQLRSDALANVYVYTPPEKRPLYGVTALKNGSYQVRVPSATGQRNVGYFKTLEEALQARDTALTHVDL
jgi:hypothetical protein